MKKHLCALAIAGMTLSVSAQAADFVNGGFEAGDLSGWSQGGGTWNGGGYPLDPFSYLGGPSNNTVTNAGTTDAITGLSTVRYGNHAVRVNDDVNNASVSVISQSVQDYDSSTIFFSWAAVLEDSHGTEDSGHFQLVVRDDNTGLNIYNQVFNSFDNGPLFSSTFGPPGIGGLWYYTQWIDVALAVTQGGDYTIALLASDCPYFGHAGYVYLDGFGVTVDPGVPEPASLALLGLGVAGLAAMRRRKA